jgi:hypothetical protein
VAKKKYSDDDDGDKELPKNVQSRIAQTFRNQGKSLRWIANEVDEVTFSPEWIRQNTVDNEEVDNA